MTSLHVVVGELIPKSFAIFSTERYALSTVTLLVWFYRLTYPIMFVFNTLTNAVVKLAGHDPNSDYEAYTGEEVQILIDESTERG
ncbi:Putative Mg2+ and Co2+ transporter CorB [Slackia heliotrinireducens]|nr:Putative Mg2+ and Co2+ transporter CorB [Slackia heliotrinireducens]